jgi:selenocysteine lyase/cysteine desulfurase
MYEFRELKKRENSPELKIGIFTGGSNVIGMYPNVDYISYLLHKFGAFAFYDFACTAPYLPLNMNGPNNMTEIMEILSDPEDIALTYKDALFISPHKFIGWPFKLLI